MTIRAISALQLALAASFCLASPSGAQNRVKYPLPAPQVGGSLGVNIHFTRPQPGEMEQLAAAGFKWIRMDFSWSHIEREKGKYDFSSYDALMAALKLHGIRALFILDYGNDLYQKGAPSTQETRAAFARFAAAAVSHFRGQGILWEMWNEPNILPFWPPAPNVADYIALAKETGRAIRVAAPDEWYVGPGVSGMDLPFIERCLQAGLLDYWDAVTFHPYRGGTNPPETAASDFRAVRGLIDRYAPRGKRIPMINSEWGYSERYESMNAEKQGKYIVRQALFNLASGLSVSIWYDWHDDGPDPKEVEHHFGTVTLDYKPKPAYRAMETLTRTLGGFTFSKRLMLDDPRDYCLLFRKGNQIALAAWTTRSAPAEVPLPAGKGAFKVVGYLGEEASASAETSGLRLTLTDSPVYLLPTGENRPLQLAAAWSPLPLLVTISSPKEAMAFLDRSRSLRNALPAGETAKGLSIVREPRLLTEEALSSRSDTPMPVRFRLIVPGTTARFTQEAALAARYPLKLTLLPFPDRTFGLRIDNPTGRPFEGEARASGVNDGGAVQIRIAEGEKQRVIAMPGMDRTASVTLWEKLRGRARPVRVQRTGAARYTPLEDFSGVVAGSPVPESAYRLIPDGNPNIGSDLKATIVSREGPGPGGAPCRAVQIDYRFDPGWKFCRFAPQGNAAEPLPGKPHALGMWVWGDGAGHILNMRFTDSAGQTFQPTVGRIDWTGWRYVMFPLTGEGAGRWGGPNDGVIRYPIRIDTLFLIDAYGGAGGKGMVFVTGAGLWEPAAR